ncbi:MAG TPA: alpha/beta hydrolase, partial [Methylomirabilota bacterium]|nr:alpha/beta hydrolase [Methylomirabilota bacterium]
MPHVSIGDADIYYEEQGRGPALMLVPGLGGQGAFWGPQARDFARDFRVIVHDHRGAGRSTHSRIKYSVDQMAADTIALMDRLGVERAHYVG